MRYNIFYTKEAEQDLVDVFEYIAKSLLVPETAKQQLKRIMNAIDSLDKMPERHKVFEDEPWYSRKLRVLPVDNYLIFYLVQKEENTVTIIRIMYSGRNLNEQLQDY